MLKSFSSPSLVAIVICLPMFLLWWQSDAQPTIDENESCSSSELEKVTSTMTREFEEMTREFDEVKNLLASNSPSELEEITSIMTREFDEVKNLLTASKPFIAVETSKQALVSALVSNCIPLLIQQNVDGSGFFNRSWAEFKVGFNNTQGNFWLGNDLLSELTLNGRYQLKFDLQSRANPSNWYYAQYSTFIVSNEQTNYTLQVGGYSGNAGRDSLNYHNGMMFSTYDRDNDLSPNNCAKITVGGFWHKDCAFCEVNSKRPSADDFNWEGLPGGKGLQSSRMWLQCK